MLYVLTGMSQVVGPKLDLVPFLSRGVGDRSDAAVQLQHVEPRRLAVDLGGGHLDRFQGGEVYLDELDVGCRGRCRSRTDALDGGLGPGARPRPEVQLSRVVLGEGREGRLAESRVASCDYVDLLAQVWDVGCWVEFRHGVLLEIWGLFADMTTGIQDIRSGGCTLGNLYFVSLEVWR